MDHTIINKYFPQLSEEQTRRFAMLGSLYEEWNAKINVISRKDIGNLYPNHVLHSLAIAKFLGDLPAGVSFLDMGTGGGFPGIPLAIFYPQCTFHLIDRIGKKIRVAQEVAAAIGLQNVTFQHGDIGECRQKYNYVVSRAVMPLNELVPLVRKNVSKTDIPGIEPNGLICLKGGDLAPETKVLPVDIYPVSDFIPESQFVEKAIVYLPI